MHCPGLVDQALEAGRNGETKGLVEILREHMEKEEVVTPALDGLFGARTQGWGLEGLDRLSRAAALAGKRAAGSPPLMAEWSPSRPAQGASLSRVPARVAGSPVRPFGR